MFRGYIQMENVLGFVTVMEQSGSKLGLMNMKLGFVYIKMGKKTLKYVFPILPTP